MNRNFFLVLLAAGLGALATASAADTNSVPAAPRLTREELREQLKSLSPAAREEKLKELREKYGKSGPERELMEKRRDELKGLSPQERESKFREWRQQANTNLAPIRVLTPEERDARRKMYRERLEKTRKDLLDKKTDGSISPEEAKRLERIEEIMKTFNLGSPAPQAPANPGTGEKKPGTQK